MRVTLCFAIAIAAAPPPTPPAPKPAVEHRVSGVLSRMHVTMPCLGGARVTEDMIQREERVLAKTSFTLLAGAARTGKVIARVKTDERGRYRVQLPAGTYCVALGDVDSEQLPDAGPEAEAPVAARDANVDADCLAALKRPRCDAQLHVSDAAVEQPLVIYSSNQCPQAWAQPCWRGPMPP